jgi:type VI secretion system protein ImpL
MNRVIAMLPSRWSISLFGTALLAGLVWVFGPLWPSLEDWPLRLTLVQAILVIWAATNLFLELRRRRRDTRLTAGLAAASAEEAATLREKFAAALRLMKKIRGTCGYLHEQPWYVIIGPPGAGKTTALLNAGLSFPLAAEMGRGAVAGVGGTRLCDWWFTEDAVLIDTAGRYTTQDSDAAVDRAGWMAFLDLLHRTRPRRPLNGIIAAIAVSDVTRETAAKRLGHAKAIRQRICEVEMRLGVRMPVYALFTKADLIAGFTQFFDDLNEAQRAQVWGMTLPLTTNPPSNFLGEFRALVDRLNRRIFQRLQEEPNLDRRGLILTFPSQFASLEQPLSEFVQAAFGKTGDDTRSLLLRGVFLTSGTQEGTPMDRLLGMMARSFGLDQRSVTAMQSGQGRSYFLKGLLRDVIFGEAMLVSRNPGAEWRRRLLRRAGFAGAGVLVVVVAALLWRVQTAEQLRIKAADAALVDYEQTARMLPLDPVSDADLSRLLPLLDQARAIHMKEDATAASPVAWWTLGFAQEAKLAAAANEIYRHALNYALLPRLIWRLEAQLRGNLTRPDFLYEATRVYLMLGNAGPLDRDLVHEWMELDWEASYSGEELAVTREALLRHLDALLKEPLPSIALDGALVAQARAAFAGVSLAQRAYSRIRPSAAAQHLPPWRPSDALGPVGVGLFVRASGRPLTEGVPGFLTLDGFHKVLLPALDKATKSVVSESWVLGTRIELDPNGPQMHALRQQIIELYENDYARTWDAMLVDLNFVQVRSLPGAAQNLYIVASPESPMRALLVSLTGQLRLSAPSTGSVPAPTTTAVTLSSANTIAQQLQAILGPTAAAAPALAQPGHKIDERYQALLSFVGDSPGAPMDEMLKSLTDIQQLMAKLAAAPVGSVSPMFPGNDNPATTLQRETRQLPQPAARWLSTISANGEALLAGNPRGQLAAVFNAPGGPAAICTGVVTGRYPFVRDSANDISLQDFSLVFGPGGLIDGFLNTMLRPYVDISAATWRPQVAEGISAPVGPRDIAQFQRAASIRHAFFAGGTATPKVRFDITPVGVDRVTKQATLDIDGTDIVASRERSHPTQITWPAAGEEGVAKLIFDPPLPGQPSGFEESGPWALLRLFARARPGPGDAPDHTTRTFQTGDRVATFELRVSPGPNPFVPALLQDFRCPVIGGS